MSGLMVTGTSTAEVEVAVAGRELETLALPVIVELRAEVVSDRSRFSN